MRSIRSSADDQTSTTTSSLVSQLKLAMTRLDAGDADIDIARSASRSEPVWLAILGLVKSVSEVISTSLPSFWKVGKDFLEGRFKKVSHFCLSSSCLCNMNRPVWVFKTFSVLCLNHTHCCCSLLPTKLRQDGAHVNVELWYTTSSNFTFLSSRRHSCFQT